jgi:hypothetical protein
MNIEEEKKYLLLIDQLPEDIQKHIRQYLPLSTMVWLNKKTYINNHSLITRRIKRYDGYIRDIIRGDNHFVFLQAMREKFKKWNVHKKYFYKNMIYANYNRFLIDLCNKHESTNCRNIIMEMCKCVKST